MKKRDYPELPLEMQIGGRDLLSERRIRLLEAIAEHGSLNAAAKALPMSYKAAWDALDAMNNLAEQPLVIRRNGGKHGGGTVLTPTGVQLVRIYRALQLEYQQSLTALQPILEQDPILDLEQLRRTVRQMHFRSSARNQFSGRVKSISIQGVQAQINIEVSAQFYIKAQVTSEAVHELLLAPEVNLLALIKAPQVKIYPVSQQTRLPKNYYIGKVSRLIPDEKRCQVNVEVTQHKQLAALITHAQFEQLALEEGLSVGIGFAPAAVVLCRYES